MGVERLSVARMRLRASDRQSVRALLPDLEDAFRTASWPDAPSQGSGGVIQIRRLDLGRISPGQSRQSLARHLASAAGRATLCYATPGRPVPEDAVALHWRGPVEMLAAALIAAHSPDPPPWWVRAALPPREPLPQSLARRLADLARKTGAEPRCLLGALVLQLLEAQASETAFEAVWDAGQALGQGDVPPVREPAHAIPDPIAAPDAAKSPQAPDAVDMLTRALKANLFATTPSLRTARRILNALPANLTPRERCVYLSWVLRAAHGPHAEAALLRSLTRTQPSAPGARAETRRRAEKPGEDPAPARKRREQLKPETHAERAQVPLPQEVVSADLPAPDDALTPDPALLPDARTRLGGVAVLVNLLTRSGLPAYDTALQTDLSLTVLRACVARRCGEEDDLLAALPEPEAAALLEIVPAGLKIRPALWTLSGPLYLGRLRQVPGRAVLSLGPRRAPIAVLDRADLRQLRAQGLDLRRDRRVWKWPDIEAELSTGLQLFLQRLCRATLGLPLRGVLDRPAWLHASATHLEITCDLNKVRIAERRAGLDLSPGWVPWLARVVNLHFEPFTQGPETGEARDEP